MLKKVDNFLLNQPSRVWDYYDGVMVASYEIEGEHYVYVWWDYNQLLQSDIYLVLQVEKKLLYKFIKGCNLNEVYIKAQTRYIHTISTEIDILYSIDNTDDFKDIETLEENINNALMLLNINN